jgi:hypothetical protein
MLISCVVMFRQMQCSGSTAAVQCFDVSSGLTDATVQQVVVARRYTIGTRKIQSNVAGSDWSCSHLRAGKLDKHSWEWKREHVRRWHGVEGEALSSWQQSTCVVVSRRMRCNGSTKAVQCSDGSNGLTAAAFQQVVDTRPCTILTREIRSMSQVQTGPAATSELGSSISTHGSGSESTSEDGSQLALFSKLFFRASEGFKGTHSHLHMPSLRLSRHGVESETRNGGPTESMLTARCWDVSAVGSMMILCVVMFRQMHCSGSTEAVQCSDGISGLTDAAVQQPMSARPYTVGTRQIHSASQFLTGPATTSGLGSSISAHGSGSESISDDARS